jgi:5-methylcytosine-specific restriction endonuclease McrA
MGTELIDHAIELVENANADLEVELLDRDSARRLLAAYARARTLVDYGIAALSRKLDDASELSRVTGTSMGTAKAVVSTGKVLATSDDLNAALRHGDISLDQASEIAKAEQCAPGAAAQLIAVAQKERFHVLRDSARRARLEVEQHRDLARRQRDARYARSYSDELGLVHIHLALEPHVGTPIVARAEAESQRLSRTARAQNIQEPSERHLADAYAKLLAGSGKGRTRRPELVVLVSHEVVKRGWRDVRPGEVCKIPGVGPVSPQVAREIATDAFLSGVFYDGKDLRHFARWSRNIPVEVAIALELGDPPGFDGVVCVDCGNRFRTEFDHIDPHVANGRASNGNLTARCWSCHQAKTQRDRKAGRLKPPEPRPRRHVQFRADRLRRIKGAKLKEDGLFEGDPHDEIRVRTVGKAEVRLDDGPSEPRIQTSCGRVLHLCR